MTTTDNTKQLDKNWLPDKSKFVDDKGRLRTQSLFLEENYGPDAIYTLKDYHHTKDGVLYPSLKLLYLEMADPTEYEFANTYLNNWRHWNRIIDNKNLQKHVYDWREELEIKIRCNGVKRAIASARGGNWNAIKFLVDKGWDVKGKGRPTKDDIAKAARIKSAIQDEFEEDFERLRLVK